MNERISFYNNHRASLIAGTVGLSALSFLVSGCTGEAKTEVRHPTTSPAEQFWGKYVSKYADAKCLSGTAYDPYGSGGTPAAASYDEKSDILTITPPVGDTLVLSGFRADDTISPVYPASQKILDAYGC